MQDRVIVHDRIVLQKRAVMQERVNVQDRAVLLIVLSCRIDHSCSKTVIIIELIRIEVTCKVEQL